ncbi:MAG: hypothetical protein SGJ20_20360, partial [Planctomycetota bacterium]|nr:hypothetical protein [Planctomycetota bacterium]
MATSHTAHAAEIVTSTANVSEPIVVSAKQGSTWKQGVYDVWLLEGDCSVRQGSLNVNGKECMLWVERQGDFGNPTHKVLVYVDGQVQISQADPRNGNAFRQSQQFMASGAAGNSNATNDSRYVGPVNSNAAERKADTAWSGKFFS